MLTMTHSLRHSVSENISSRASCDAKKTVFSDLLQIGSKFGHWETFLVTCIVTLPWNVFLTTTWHIYIIVSNLVMRCDYLHIWPPDDTSCASCKVAHLMVPLALVTKLSTRWCHLHWFQIWPPDGANCISCKFTHQMAPQRTRFVLTVS